MDQAMGIRPTPGQLRVRNYTLKALIMECYRLGNYQIGGVSGWMSSARYDIDAKIPENNTTPLWPTMMETLLKERFQLRFHHETKQLTVYQLVVAKQGPKFSQSDTGEKEPAGLAIRPDGLTGHKVSMRWFTGALSGQLDRQIANKTNLVGDYDFSVRYEPEDGRKTDLADSPEESIFTAIQEQLGLKLETGKGPVDVLVVDHAERPSEN
jgi:uncharacterized protein (TIGR03435 family)